MSMFVSFISGKKLSESDSNDIVSLCLYRYSCGVDSANSLILRTIFRTISLSLSLQLSFLV